MPRPRKQAHEKRTEAVKTDLTEAEKIIVAEHAEASDLSVAAYMRFRLLHTKSLPTTSSDLEKLIMQLNRLGMTLQSILKRLEAKESGPTLSSDLSLLITQVSHTLEQVLLDDH